MRVILADNQAIYREGIARVLLNISTEIVAQCADLPSLLAAINSFAGSIVIFTSSLTQDLSALLVALDQAGCPAIMILEREFFLDPTTTLRVRGVMRRSVQVPLLIDCLRSVAAGVRYSQPAMVRPRLPPVDLAGVKAAQRLTPRELQIVGLICEGRKNKQIAQQMGTNEQVIKNNLRSIYAKAGVSDRLELALFAMHHRALGERVGSTRLAQMRTE